MVAGVEGKVAFVVLAVQGGADESLVAGGISSEAAERAMQYFVRRIPMRKLGRPGDIARICIWHRMTRTM